MFERRALVTKQRPQLFIVVERGDRGAAHRLEETVPGQSFQEGELLVGAGVLEGLAQGLVDAGDAVGKHFGGIGIAGRLAVQRGDHAHIELVR